jgi:hypothetical protein
MREFVPKSSIFAESRDLSPVFEPDFTRKDDAE